MAKIGRNDLCPCGSGKKYKKCCLAGDEAAARAARPAQPAAVPERRPSLASYVQEHDELDELTEASNAVVDMVQAGNLDAAEQAAHELLTRFPDVHAAYYRRAITVIRKHPDTYDPAFEAIFQRLIDRLEPAESIGGSAPKNPRDI
jgi:soluble cytochrome b562